MSDSENDVEKVFFSVVIPTYNRAEFIKVAVNSVLSQSYTNFEIVIVDDGSTDNTRDVVQTSYHGDNRITYHIQKNSERAAARNNGAKIAKGDYVIFFDSDDYLLPNHLETAAGFIQSRQRPEVFHLNYEVRDHNGKLMSMGPSGIFTANSSLIAGNILSCNGVVVRRDIALLNTFNETRALSAMEDWELWIRLASMYPIYLVPQVTSVVVNHDMRSVLQTNNDALIKRVELLISLVSGHVGVQSYYKDKLSIFRASCFSYVALHLAITKRHRRQAIEYLMKGVAANPSVIFQRRFLATVKHIL